MSTPIHGVEVFLPRLVEQGHGGHILFTSSFSGLLPNVGLGAYCVAKYGIVAMSEVLAREVRDQGISVSVLCTMIVATDIGTSERNRAQAPMRHLCPDHSPQAISRPLIDSAGDCRRRVAR
jgi:short-subunit dehydrogenase